METPECPIKSLSLDEAIAHADEVAGDCGTDCKREHKQLADWLRELKSRRSAERGDCAKLREALDESRRIASDLGGCRLNDYWKLNEIVRVCESALAAPPRNCDMPLVVDGPADNNADKAWIVFKRHNPDAYFDVPGLLRCIDWLLAPATEKEGGNNGK